MINAHGMEDFIPGVQQKWMMMDFFWIKIGVIAIRIVLLMKIQESTQLLI
jgi:hypothetical protein